jgi:hypothetical protein
MTILEREHGHILQHNPQEFTSLIRGFRNFFDNGVLVRNMQEFVEQGSVFAAPQHRLMVQVPKTSAQPLQVFGRYSQTGYLLRPLAMDSSNAVFANENLLVYPDVWPDVDIHIQLTGNGVKQDYVIKGPQAPAALEFSLTPLAGASVVLEADGIHVRRDADNEFFFPLPKGEDGRLGSFELQGNVLTMHLPDLSGVSFPYTVDPYSVEIGRGSELSAIYDGDTARSSADSTWTSLRDGNGTNVDTAGTINDLGYNCGTTTDRYNNNWRFEVNFPTDVGNHIPARAQILSATVTMQKNSIATSGYTTVPDYNVIFTHGDDQTFVPTTSSYQDIGQDGGGKNGGGDYPKWSNSQDPRDSAWSTATDKVFTLNAAALAALPNRPGSQTNWNLALVMEELECDGVTPSWESGAFYRLSVYSNNNGTASRRPLLTVNYQLQPIVSYYIF